MNRSYITARRRLGLALLLSSFLGVVLYIAAPASRVHSFSYLPWNLFLAWVALASALWLERVVKRSAWSSWEAIISSAVWLFLLPNTFYMVSDFVHLQLLNSTDLLYIVPMFTLFICNGFILGLISLYVVHMQLMQRLSGRAAFLVIQGILLACSFGIYIGRELRWNTWDVVANFSSVLFDVSDRLLSPGNHPQTVPVTASFFVLLSSVYLVFWHMVKLARVSKVE